MFLLYHIRYEELASLTINKLVSFQPALPRSSELLLVVHTEAEPFGGSTSLGQRGQLPTGRKAATPEARLHQAEAAGHVERGITKGSVVLGNMGK